MQLIGLLDPYIDIPVRNVDLPDTVLEALSSSNGMKFRLSRPLKGRSMNELLRYIPETRCLERGRICASWDLSLATLTKHYEIAHSVLDHCYEAVFFYACSHFRSTATPHQELRVYITS
jgi:hypothetical protein